MSQKCMPAKKQSTVTALANAITRDEAFKLCPDYVAFVEGDFDKTEAVINPFMWNYDKPDGHGYAGVDIKVGQSAITFTEGQFVRVKIASIKQPGHDADGPVVRVSNGEYSWRVDGDNYAHLL